VAPTTMDPERFRCSKSRRLFAVGPRPKRSILIVFHTGEELGLYGSEFNTDYEPVVPLKKLVADLNIDMVGRSRPEGDEDPRDARLTDKDSIYIIGADKLSTELHKLKRRLPVQRASTRISSASGGCVPPYRCSDQQPALKAAYRHSPC